MPPLYPTEAEIARELFGQRRDAAEQWAGISRVWERQGLPLADPHTGRRYWPAVRAFLDRRAGLREHGPSPTTDGEERFNDPPIRARRQTQAAR